MVDDYFRCIEVTWLPVAPSGVRMSLTSEGATPHTTTKARNCNHFTRLKIQVNNTESTLFRGNILIEGFNFVSDQVSEGFSSLVCHNRLSDTRECPLLSLIGLCQKVEVHSRVTLQSEIKLIYNRNLVNIL